MREMGTYAGLFKIAERTGDVVDVFRAEFAAFAAQALAHLLPEGAGVDQLQLATAGGGFAVADDPYIGADAGVVEHVGGQADDGFDQIVFQHIAADLALAGTCAACEQRRAIEHDTEAAAAIHGGTHLGHEVQQKQQRTVADTRQAGAEATVKSLLFGFLADFLFDFLPLNAERRIGEHVVEHLAVQAVGGKRIAENDVGDVLALDEDVGLADGIGLGVQLLSVHDHPGVGIEAG